MQTILEDFTDDEVKCLEGLLTAKVTPALTRLISLSPPHEILALLCCATKHNLKGLAKEISRLRLSDLAQKLEELHERDPSLEAKNLRDWLDVLEPGLSKPFESLLHPKNRRSRQVHKNVLDFITSETTLADYCHYPAKPEAELLFYVRIGMELPLIAAAQEGDMDAFDRLHHRYDSTLRGFVAARVSQDADIKNIAQDAWVRVWNKIGDFDPSYGTFGSFIKRSAAIMILRHFSRIKHLRRFELLLTDFAASIPGLEEDKDVLNFIDEVQEQAKDSEPMEPLPNDLLDQLLNLIFRCAGPPTHAFSFGYVKLLRDWTPSKIRTELAEYTFGKLLSHLRQELMPEYCLTAARADAALQPLADKLVLSEAKKDCLRNYLTYREMQRLKGGKPLTEPEQDAADITKWWNGALVRIRVCLSVVDGQLGQFLDDLI